MRVPVWLTLGVAALVMIFGVYRIRMALRREQAAASAPPRKGLYAMGRRTHLLVGIVYLLLASALAATSFGWNPFGRAVSPDTAAPTKDTTPTMDGVPTDGLPHKK